MSFLDSLENNLKALENQEQGGIDQSRRREAERSRALAVAPWAERLKASPYVAAIMQQATRAGHARRLKINLLWVGTTFRLEARGQRLELRPMESGVEAVFHEHREKVDLDGGPEGVLGRWLAMLDEQKKLDEARIAELPEED